MVYVCVFFVALMLAISLYDFFKIRNFQDFAVAGKNQTFLPVLLSLCASMIGASATLGVSERVVEIGFPAFWWLGVGSFALVLQSLMVSKKIRGLEANTLPDVAHITVGSGARTILAAIIVIAWVGIIAAQIVSIAKIVAVVWYNFSANKNTLVFFITLALILYTVLGGQKSVVKTDMIQSGIIFCGVVFCFIYLYCFTESDTCKVINKVQVLNQNFGTMDLINLAFITGGTYFLGPDLVSRNLISKDKKTAQKATFVAAIILAVFGILITFIGMWVAENVPDEILKDVNPLVFLIENIIPKPLSILLCLALLATLFSSVDTCLVNAATIVEYDLFRKKRVWVIRILIVALGIISGIIALSNQSIIALLLNAYSIYSPGVVFPLLFAILFYPKKQPRKVLWFLAVIIGGFSGLLQFYFNLGFEYLPLIGMTVSLVLSLLSFLI